MKIKSYADLEQSKKLAEILPIESANMHYPLPCSESNIPVFGKGGFGSTPCWSLTALLYVLPEIKGSKPIIALDDNYITYPHMSNLYVEADNIVDACVTMIEKLHELKLL